MPATWPATLPQRLNQQGYSESVADGRLRTAMDAGPAKVRRRAGAPVPLSGTLRMSGAQVLAARAFVDDDLEGGSLPFYFPDPLTQVPVLVRFGEALPSWSCVGGDWYDFMMPLEVLP